MFLFRFCQHLSPVFIQLENRPQSQCILNYIHEVKEFGTQQSFKTSKSNCTTLGTVIHLWCAKGECRTCLRFPSIFNNNDKTTNNDVCKYKENKQKHIYGCYTGFFLGLIRCVPYLKKY